MTHIPLQILEAIFYAQENGTQNFMWIGISKDYKIIYNILLLLYFLKDLKYLMLLLTKRISIISRYVPSEDLANIITLYYGEERVKDYVIFDCATELQVLRIIENNLGIILV